MVRPWLHSENDPSRVWKFGVRNLLPYYMKSIRHIYRTHEYRTTCNSYELLLEKMQNLGQILIPLKF